LVREVRVATTAGRPWPQRFLAAFDRATDRNKPFGVRVEDPA
jgi:hypothetical protein